MPMSHSTKSAPAGKPAKPRATPSDFPLFPADKGPGAKKIRGKHSYFESWREDLEGKAALATYEREWRCLREDTAPDRCFRQVQSSTVRLLPMM